MKSSNLKKLILLPALCLAVLLLAGCFAETKTGESVAQTEAAESIDIMELPETSGEILIEVDSNEDQPEGTPTTAETPFTEPAVETPAAETTASADTPALRYAVSSVNVRTAPSTEAEAAGKLQTGESVEYLGEEDAEWTKVIYKGNPCYISSAFLTDDEESVSGSVYSYERMEKRLNKLTQENPELVALSDIATTADGRKVYCLRVGPENAEKKVLFTASIHAREYITTELLMGLMENYITNIREGQSYGSLGYRDLSEKCAVYFVPMINPDGVTISQYGPEGLKSTALQEQVRTIAKADGNSGTESYYRRWKSNAEGIDLNRQFDALWEQYNDGVGHPSADHYKGKEPGSTAEAKGLIALTEKEQFDRTVSYHTAGSVIYWYFGQDGQLLTDTKAFADRISNVTGYPTDANYESLDPAGYKDWAIIKRGIPSLTIEVGNGDSPLDPEQLGSIRQRNQRVIEETCLSALGL